MPNLTSLCDGWLHHSPGFFSTMRKNKLGLSQSIISPNSGQTRFVMPFVRCGTPRESRGFRTISIFVQSSLTKLLWRRVRKKKSLIGRNESPWCRPMELSVVYVLRRVSVRTGTSGYLPISEPWAGNYQKMGSRGFHGYLRNGKQRKAM